MTEQLPDLIERVTTLDHLAVILAGYTVTAHRHPLGIVQIHKRDLVEIAEALRCYGLMMKAEVRELEEQQAAPPDLPIASAA